MTYILDRVSRSMPRPVLVALLVVLMTGLARAEPLRLAFLGYLHIAM